VIEAAGRPGTPPPRRDAAIAEGVAATRRRVGPVILAADLKAAFDRFRDDQVTFYAAGLTYYSLLSLFPALLFAVAVLGVFGQQGLIGDAASYLKTAGAPRSTVDAVTSALQSAQSQRGTAATALVLGLGTSLYGASGAFGAAGQALNVIWRVEEGRGFVRHKLHDLLWTVVVVALVLVTFVLVFLGGGLAGDVLGAIGLGDTAASIWRVVRWPGALLAAMLIYAIVYYAAPNVQIRHWRFITPGAVFGVIAWIAASAVFFVYVSGFSSYSATYGAFAAIVILLVWLWLTNVVLLFGAELNYVVERRRTPGLADDYDGPLMPAKDPADD
jgi:membrane protein